MIKKVVAIIMMIFSTSLLSNTEFNKIEKEAFQKNNYEELELFYKLNSLISFSEETEIDKETIFEVEFLPPKKYTAGIFRKKTYTYYPTIYEFGYAFKIDNLELDDKIGNCFFLLTFYSMDNHPVAAYLISKDLQWIEYGGARGKFEITKEMCGKKYKCKVQMLEDFKIKLPEKVRFYFSTQTTK